MKEAERAAEESPEEKVVLEERERGLCGRGYFRALGCCCLNLFRGGVVLVSRKIDFLKKKATAEQRSSETPPATPKNTPPPRAAILAETPAEAAVAAEPRLKFF